MNDTRAVKDLAIGDVIQVDGFEDTMAVRSAKKIKKGLDAGKLEVKLVAPDGETEVMAFAPEEQVKVVGKADASDKGNSGAQSQGGNKAKGKTKTKAKTTAEPDGEPAAAAASRAAQAPASEPEAKTAPKGRGRKKAAGNNQKLSALDAAAKVLSASGQALTCQEMIQAMAEKGYWTSPGRHGGRRVAGA
jgi:hypothetical protein